MDPAEALTALGGVATRRRLVGACGRRDVDRAVREGRIAILSRDRYASPAVDAAVAQAHALSGFLCLASAALHHGWGVLRLPDEPDIALPRGRKVRATYSGANLHQFELAPDDVVDDIATSKRATLLHCLRGLPGAEALAIADSAARAGDLTALRHAALLARGPGAAKVRRIAGLARAEAANPFESALRAIALTVPGLDVEPQVLITSVEPWARVDLADRDLRIVLEADSFEWHGHRSALVADTDRYNRLVADGWRVLRFSWEAVMFRPEEVRRTLLAVVGLVPGPTKVARRPRSSARRRAA